MGLKSFYGEPLPRIETLQECIRIMVLRFDPYYHKYPLADQANFWKQENLQLRLNEFCDRNPIANKVFHEMLTENTNLKRDLESLMQIEYKMTNELLEEKLNEYKRNGS